MPTPNDVPTIGWGHTKGVKMGDSCTIMQADEWLREDCRDAENEVNRCVRAIITQNQFDALVSFVFNIGGPNFRASTLLSKLNSGDYAGAAAQFPRWNKQGGVVLNGLTRRRAQEMALFLKPAEGQ
jgi:lysozyme